MAGAYHVDARIDHYSLPRPQPYRRWTDTSDTNTEPSRSMRLNLLNQGVLYRNPDPGMRAECAFLPNVVAISDEEAICIYRIGQAFYSTDGTLNILRTTDGGRTWTEEGKLWDISNDDRPYSYTAPHGFRLLGGTIVVNAFRLDYTDSRPQFNPRTGGHRPSEKIAFFSEDNGQSWSNPQVLTLPIGHADTPSSIIEMNDGRWWMGLELWKEWDDEGPLHIRGYTTVSDDQGRTWQQATPMASGSDQGKMFSHSRYTKMLDGRIAALQWTQAPGSAEDQDLHFTISNADVSEWTYPTPTGVRGQTSWVCDLGNEVLAAVYTSRDRVKPGINIVLSEDEGATWDLERELQLWDAVGQEWLGVERAPEYPKSHDNIAFGKPNLARMADGTLIASWWCTQACVTHSRYARISVD